MQWRRPNRRAVAASATKGVMDGGWAGEAERAARVRWGSENKRQCTCGDEECRRRRCNGRRGTLAAEGRCNESADDATRHSKNDCCARATSGDERQRQCDRDAVRREPCGRSVLEILLRAADAAHISVCVHVTMLSAPMISRWEIVQPRHSTRTRKSASSTVSRASTSVCRVSFGRS